MRPNRTSLCFLITFVLFFFLTVFARAQNAPSEQVQVGPPPLHRAEPPKAEANHEDLEKRGDELRSTKYYLDAIDYYNAALQKKPNDSVLLNKLGITELQLQHYKDAKKNFERSIKNNRQYADIPAFRHKCRSLRTAPITIMYWPSSTPRWAPRTVLCNTSGEPWRRATKVSATCIKMPSSRTCARIQDSPP